MRVSNYWPSVHFCITIPVMFVFVSMRYTVVLSADLSVYGFLLIVNVMRYWQWWFLFDLAVEMTCLRDVCMGELWPLSRVAMTFDTFPAGPDASSMCSSITRQDEKTDPAFWAAGGLPLWSQTQAVEIAQGLPQHVVSPNINSLTRKPQVHILTAFWQHLFCNIHLGSVRLFHCLWKKCLVFTEACI